MSVREAKVLRKGMLETQEIAPAVIVEKSVSMAVTMTIRAALNI